MRVLLVPRKGDPNIAAGWIARVGSVNERPGITGLSHLFEHMMFKGTHAIGTKDIDENLKLIKEMDDVRAELRKGTAGADPESAAGRNRRRQRSEVSFGASSRNCSRSSTS